MPRRFTDDELVLASHNDGKLREISALFADYPFRVTSAKTYSLPEPEETEDSFLGNAALKARATAAATGLPALADDSGLVVPALNGAPGIYSARWAGPTRISSWPCRRLKARLPPAAAPTAAPISSAPWCYAGRTGMRRIRGADRWQPCSSTRGDRGFGYDPIFVARGHDLTFGEMEPQEKLDIGHRADAFAKLVAACFP